jgi:REP element-mobilizing transposase RayT
MQEEKYLGKYKIASNRNPLWDYSRYGKYFITIIIQDRKKYFGHIKNQKMILNDFGKIAHNEWKISGRIRKEIEMKTFVVMPNHLHGIVILHDNKQYYETDFEFDSKFYRKPKSISSFIAGYKSSVTTKINNFIDENPKILSELNINQKFNRKNRLWQTNYYAHIIRNTNELNRIHYYIINNPQKQ